MKKRLFALFLCLCMVMTLLPVSVFAEGTEAQYGLVGGGASVTSVNPVETPDTHITFKFYNGETLLDTQVVNADGQLTAPATPAIGSSRKFLGWYAVDDKGQLEAQEFDFSNAYTTYSGRSEVKVMAKFEAVYYVYFMTVDGQVHSTAIANEANDFKVTPPTDYEPKGKKVTGWVVGDNEFTANTVVSADTYVYPVTADCYWVTFNTTGGSMVPSSSVTKGDTLELSGVTAPTRTGYTFKGWSLSENGTLITSITPAADTTLYAVWEGKNVNYTVVYWGQNPDNPYVYDTLLGSDASKTAKVGETVTGSSTIPTSIANRQYFTYKDSDSAVVSADGSTVINVRLNRKIYKVTFDLGNSSKNSMTVNGKTYYGGRNAEKYVLEARYEQNIESLWPTASNFNSDSGFQGWSITGIKNIATSKRITMTADLCSSSGKTAKANYNASCLDHLYYMFESFDQTSPINENERMYFNGVYYDKSTEYSQDANSGGGDWDQKAITGMKASGTQTTVLQDDGLWFNPNPKERNVFLYYTRNEYKLIKSNYGTQTTESMKYGAPLDDKGAAPARPAGFSESAVFKGWYTVPVAQITDTTLPYDFSGKTMPLDGLTLYAYWVKQPVTLTVQVPSIGYDKSNSEVAIGTVISGVDVFKDAEAEIAEAGRTVLKWVYEDGTAVDVNSAIDRNTTIKAVLEGEVYNLTYDTGTDASITDENRYEYEALAQVKDGSGLKNGKQMFAYWTDDAGNVYYPGSYVTMTRDMTLTAHYVDPSVKVMLTYHANYTGNDETFTTDAVPNNDKVTVMAYDATGLPSRLGYQFKGWADTADADTANYPAGSEARLDNNGSNDLYAVWEAIDVNYKVEFYYQDSKGNYPDKANHDDIVTRQGETDSTVSVTDDDKLPKQNGKYVYDESYTGNVERGIVAADGSLVLKLYFKLNQASCTVRYLWNGTNEKVAEDDVFDSQTVSKTFTANPKPIANCTIVPEHDVTKSIPVNPDSDNNVITFYYYQNVTLTANSDSKPYDGTEHSVSGFTGAPEEADFSAITVGASGTDAGTYPAAFAEGTVGTTDAAKKYIVVEANDGRLVISPISAVITIEAASDSKPYDGTPLTKDRYTFTQGVLVNGDILHVVVEGSVIDVDEGKVVNEITRYYVTTADGSRDVTKSYTFGEIVNGTLEITPREITLTSGSDEKIYDGTPLTKDEVTVSAPGFVDGEGATYTVTGSQTKVGESDNSFTYKLNDNTYASNYTITPEYGKLKVKPVTAEVVVTITEHSGSAKYDGTEKTVTGYDVTSISNPLYTVNDFNFSGDATIKGTDADTYAMNLVPGNFENNNPNFKNVRFNILDGTLVITPRPVTLTSGGGEKEYDGTPLTNSTVTVGGSGFVAGEGATYQVTGSQTDAGSSDNSFTYTLNDNTKADNYIITKELGKLTVTQKSSEITIKALSDSKLYDGTPLTNDKYEFTQNILADGDVLHVTVEGSITNYEDGVDGKVANVVTDYYVTNSNGDVITENYKFAPSINGTLEIIRRNVTLTSATDDKVYDGTPLTKDEVTVSGDGFAENEGATYDVTGSQTDAGSSDNSFTYTLNDNTKAGNYIITTVVGKLTVTASDKEVVVYISGNTGTEKYDGTEKAVTGYEVTGISNNLYKESDFTFSGKATVSATDVKETAYMMGLTAADFENTNENFSKVTFIVTDGSLTITPRKVTLTSQSKTKEYDGSPLTRPDVTVSGDGFVDGEVTDIKAIGTITMVGEVDNDIVYTKGANFKDSNYIVTPVIGKLGITQSTKEIKVAANSNNWEYDGKFHADGGYTVTFGTETYTVAAGESATLSTGDTVTAVITKQVKNVADSVDGNNAIVTLTIYNRAQYAKVSQANGTLTITAKPLTIKADDDEKVYDGQPLTKDSFTNTDLAEGDVLTATVTGSQTNVGSSDNIASDAVIMAGDENVTANYTITYEKGTLTVTPVTDEVIVTVTERGGDYLYDGKEKLVEGYDAVSSNPLYTAADYSFSGDATVNGTNAGSYDMELVPEDFENTSPNFTNITFIIVDGKLNIAQRKVLMTSADGEKVYDGTPLTNSTVTVTGDGFAEGEGAAYNVTGSQLDEGSSDNSFTYELNEGTLAANYIIETAEGKLTVKPILTEITITAESDEKMYDGSALTNGNFTFTDGILIEGDVLTAVVEGSQLNAGSSANVVKSHVVMRGDTDVTANYRFADYVDGKLTVTARKVLMTSADDEKVYDGTPLTNDKVTVTGDGFIEGEGATYDVTGSQLDVGSSDNTFTYELNEGTLADNYIIETEEGELTVTCPEQHIVITANSAEKTYDGTPLTDDGFTYTDFVLAEGDVLTAVVEGSQTDAGSSANVVKSYRVMRGDEDVTANYIFDDPVDGTLTVTKRKVTLTSGTACKIYDGKYLTCNKVEVGDDGFVEGEGATYDVTGKRKDIGWSYNDFTYTLNDNTKADNYEITIERGILYVKDQAEKPKTGDSSDLLLLLALMSMSGAGAAGTAYLFRRKREEQE